MLRLWRTPCGAGVGVPRVSPALLAASVVVAAFAAATATAGEEPAYVVRGRQTELQQRAFEERLDRVHDRLAASVERVAPDLRSLLEPPPKRAVGYQLLP